MANINIKLPDEIHKQLKIEAINNNLTLKEHIILKLKDKVKDK